MSKIHLTKDDLKRLGPQAKALIEPKPTPTPVVLPPDMLPKYVPPDPRDIHVRHAKPPAGPFGRHPRSGCGYFGDRNDVLGMIARRDPDKKYSAKLNEEA